MITYLSLGAGVDTTAICLMEDVMDKVDFVLFADTGSENPKTYEYLESYLKPYLIKEKIPLITVKADIKIKGEKISNMEEAYLKWNMIPVRFMRHCTDRFKVRPMHKYLKENYPNEELKVIIGFAYDELQRVNTTRWKDQITWFPLIDKKMTRNDCIHFIKNKGFPVPPKSGCYYCPFQRLDQWKNLRFEYPNLWERAIKLEKNGSHYPSITLSNFKKSGKNLTLEEVDQNLGKNLFDYDYNPENEECTGVCMV